MEAVRNWICILNMYRQCFCLNYLIPASQFTSSYQRYLRYRYNRVPLKRGAVKHDNASITAMTKAEHKSRVSCQKGSTHHAYAWQIGPFWQDTLEIKACTHKRHPIYHSHGRAMGHILWIFWKLTVITAPHCIFLVMQQKRWQSHIICLS